MSQISKDLLLAILAMDSYNRGYGVGIAGLSDDNYTAVGNATVKRASSSLETSDEVQAGFYAIAYDVKAAGVADLDDDTTVIAYRGTDDARDTVHSWTISSGNILTGHSLGGGLANGNHCETIRLIA